MSRSFPTHLIVGLVALVPTLSAKQLPQAFVSEAWSAIKANIKLEQTTANGISLLEFQSLYNDSSSELATLKEMWPDGLDKSALSKLNEADLYWHGALTCWLLKFDDRSNINEMVGEEEVVENILIKASVYHPESGIKVDDFKSNILQPNMDNDGVTQKLIILANQLSKDGRQQLKVVLSQ